MPETVVGMIGLSLNDEGGREVVSRYVTITKLLSKVVLLREDQSLLDRMHGQRVASYRVTMPEDKQPFYASLDADLRPLELFALLREEDDGVVLHLIRGRIYAPHEVNLYVPLLLFVATMFSVLYTGTTIAAGEIGLSDPAAVQAIGNNLLPNLWRGLPYAISILLILGGHEMGHWLQMRRHGVASSLPYFLPAFGLSPLGTFGAGIALREPMRDRRVLFDVGATGPWVGFIIAVPILLIGLATSIVVPIGEGAVEGNSITYWLAKVLVFGRALPNESVDVLVNQLAWAGWTGLFVTAINLIPLGQLDGGHVTYALFGRQIRQLFNPLMALIAFGALFLSSAWVVLGLLAALIGRVYAVPLDDITPLDTRRQRIAYATIVLFVLCLVPIPLAMRGANDGLLSGVFATVLLVMWRKRST